MGRASDTQHGVNAGELSALLLGRQDLEKYAMSLFVCLNALPLTQGPWTRRPGTAYLHQTRHHDKVSRVVPFQYSVTQTYILEFGESYIRFFTEHGILTNAAQSITSITKAAVGVVTKISHGYSDGDRLYLSSMVGMTQLGSREVVVTNKTADTFELYDSDGNAIATTGYGTFTSGNMASIFEVTTTFDEADIDDIRFTQSADVLYILHPDFPPQQLVRVSALSWVLSDVVFTDGPYEATNTTATTLTPNVAVAFTGTAITDAVDSGAGEIRITSGTHGLLTGDHVTVEDVGGTVEANGDWFVTRIDANTVDLDGSAFVNTYTAGGLITEHAVLTASSIAGINSDTGFQATDEGRLIRMSEGGTWGYALVRGVRSTTIADIKILSTLTNTNAKATWRMGLWSDTTGFPAAGTFHEDRLWLAGAALSPQRLDGSKTGAYTNFSPTATTGTVADDNAVAFTLNSDDVNAIRWLSSNEKGLMVGTSRGEWQVKAASLTEAITPTNISARPSSRYGSTSAAPVNAGRALLFVQRAARKLRELAFVFEADGFRAPDMTLLAEHITRPSLDEIVYQEQPQAIVWGRRGDGVLTGFTYERDQGVTAWHRHELGGQSDADALLIPVVESLAVVPEPEGTRDELYLVVQRYINGGTKRYIEYMSKIWEVEDVQEDAFHLDCGWTTVNSPASDTVTGLWHLEGETVSAYADGTKHPPVTVTNGTITLGGDFSIITLGYAYNSDGQTMPLEGGAQDGSAQGKIKRIGRIGFWLIDTLGLKFGRDADNLSEIINRQWGDAYGQATPLFTGVVRKRFEGDYDLLGQVYWRADGPFPATVAAIMPQYTVSDDS
jgi:hypothetical protein